MTIFMTLHALTFRGIVLSIASFAYHCLGFDPGCPRHKVLTRLAAEGLIELHGKTVTAVPLAEFAEALHARPEFL